MVKCRNKDKQIFQEQAPKYWQRAITYPEYDFFPMCNVGGYRGNGVMQMRPLFYNSGQMVYGKNNRRFIKEQKNWCSTLPERNIGPPHYNKKANCQLQDLNTKQGISKNLFDSTKVLEFYSSITGTVSLNFHPSLFPYLLCFSMIVIHKSTVPENIL